MTRYARGNKGNHKRPHDATSWSDLHSQASQQGLQVQQRTTGQDGSSSQTHKLPRKKTAKLKKTQNHAGGIKNILKITEGLDDEIKEDWNIVLSERLASSKEKLSGQEREDTRIGSEEKKDKRREDRRLKRIKKKANRMVCYHCREAGHGIADCPKMLRDEEQGTGICFRCGSTEHEANKCTAKVDPTKEAFPFAKCFICQETGHLSRSCPDNQRGLYPLGGGCKHCGSVEHRNQHCPQGKEINQDWHESTLPTLSSTLTLSADATIEELTPSTVSRLQVKKKTPKVVKF